MSLISREIANKLDYNVGYDGHYDYVFIIDSHDNITPVPYETGKKFRFIPRPSYDDLRDWLRYAYDIDIDIVTIPTFSLANKKMYGWSVYGASDGCSNNIIGTWRLGESGYYKALDEALKVAFKYIKGEIEDEDKLPK